MKTDALIKAEIASHIQVGMAPEWPSLRIYFGNHKPNPNSGQPWCVINVIPNTQARVNIGSPKDFKACGVINCQIMAPENTGEQTAMDIRDSLVSLLVDRQLPVAPLGSVTLYGAEKRTRGVINGWYTLGLVLEYRAFVRLDV